ncbi:hypothetical protein BC643_1244 [Mangrovibacterium diazotrophicum]|uniref:Uncharacterized protein n=1 Tax=Mangrovibacterium diazotrophicum TaxID=1261403 RepID=A0A419W615_9BACT|nr:hypothetical protein BC643_1244 [Mangrovibacterium diazotrophicum]
MQNETHKSGIQTNYTFDKEEAKPSNIRILIS